MGFFWQLARGNRSRWAFFGKSLKRLVHDGVLCRTQSRESFTTGFFCPSARDGILLASGGVSEIMPNAGMYQRRRVRCAPGSGSAAVRKRQAAADSSRRRAGCGKRQPAARGKRAAARGRRRAADSGQRLAATGGTRQAASGSRRHAAHGKRQAAAGGTRQAASGSRRPAASGNWRHAASGRRPAARGKRRRAASSSPGSKLRLAAAGGTRMHVRDQRSGARTAAGRRHHGTNRHSTGLQGSAR